MVYVGETFCKDLSDSIYYVYLDARSQIGIPGNLVNV